MFPKLSFPRPWLTMKVYVELVDLVDLLLRRFGRREDVAGAIPEGLRGGWRGKRGRD